MKGMISVSESERTETEEDVLEQTDDGPIPSEDDCGIPIEWKPEGHGYLGGYIGWKCEGLPCG